MAEEHTEAPRWPRPRQDRVDTATGNELAGVLWVARRRILITGVVGFMLGSLAGFLLPSHYTSSIAFIPEEPTSGSMPSGLSGLAAQFGVAPGSPGRSPEFYARLLNGRYVREKVAAMSLPDGESLIGYYGFGDRTDSIARTMRRLTDDYSVSVDRATSIVRVDVEMRDPHIAAEVARMFVAQVDSFNTQLRRSSARERRIFADARLAEAQEKLTSAEAAMRDFMSHNRAGNTPALQFERGRLERQVSIAQELYLNLARGSQTARLDEVDGTPVISIVAPAFVPDRRSRPRPLFIGFLTGMIGAAASGALVTFRRMSDHTAVG